MLTINALEYPINNHKEFDTRPNRGSRLLYDRETCSRSHKVARRQNLSTAPRRRHSRGDRCEGSGRVRTSFLTDRHSRDARGGKFHPNPRRARSRGGVRDTARRFLRETDTSRCSSVARKVVYGGSDGGGGARGDGRVFRDDQGRPERGGHIVEARRGDEGCGIGSARRERRVRASTTRR